MIRKMTARAQVVRVADEALARKRAGETVSAIFDDLIERGEIDMVLRSFSRWVNRLEKGKNFVPLAEPFSNTGTAARTRSGQPKTEDNNREFDRSRPELPGDLRHARIGTPLPSMPNTTPDMKALFGEEN